MLNIYSEPDVVLDTSGGEASGVWFHGRKSESAVERTWEEEHCVSKGCGPSHLNI